MRYLFSLPLALLVPSLWGQTTWHVDATACPGPGSGSEEEPFCTLQQGIDAASDGDMVLVGPGLYVEDVLVPGKRLTLRGAGIGHTELRGLDLAALELLPGSNLELADLTVAGPLEPRAGVISRQASLAVLGCRFVGTRGVLIAGAIQAEDTELVVRDSAFEDTGAYRGGAIGALRGSVRIEGCWFGDIVGRIGGAILGEDCPVVVSESVFVECHADFGGALNALGGTVQVSQCKFLRNGGYYPAQSGGALWLMSVEAIVSNCSFEECYIFGNGSAIWLQGGRLVLEDSTCSRNYVGDLAGTVAVLDAEARLRRCDFIDNETSDGWGGALYLAVGASDEVTIEDCHFEQNRAAEGGAVCLRRGFAEITRCRFTGNRAGAGYFYERGHGGGLFVGGFPMDPPGGAAARVRRCVFDKNAALGHSFLNAGQGGGVYGPVEALNCTFYANRAGAYGVPELPSGGAASGGALLWNCISLQDYPEPLEGAVASGWSDLPEAWPGPGNFVAEPGFWAPDAGDFRLLPASPCIDRGDPTQFDKDGTRIDVGAVPYQLELSAISRRR